LLSYEEEEELKDWRKRRKRMKKEGRRNRGWEHSLGT
jgi:hypothetical protein